MTQISELHKISQEMHNDTYIYFIRDKYKLVYKEYINIIILDYDI